MRHRRCPGAKPRLSQMCGFPAALSGAARAAAARSEGPSGPIQPPLGLWDANRDDVPFVDDLDLHRPAGRGSTSIDVARPRAKTVRWPRVNRRRPRWTRAGLLERRDVVEHVQPRP